MLRTVRAGAETLAWASQPVRIDADVYVAGLEGAEAAVLDAEPDTRPFRVELPVADAIALAPAFMPTLRPMAGPVGCALAALGRERPGARRIVASPGVAGALWAQLVEEERALRSRAERIACAKAATRDALFRRVLLGADYIQSNFAEPLRVERLASISNLSPFHFARLFALVMDATPHAFLVRKRIAVARRLLASGLARGEVADRAGFGCRSTLFRHLKLGAVAAA